MALTCAQIVATANNIAKTQGYTTIAGQLLNSILNELAESYDFEVQKNTSFTVTTTHGANFNSGPFVLPVDYLRAAPGEVSYTVNGTPYILSQWPIAKWRQNFLGQGTQDQPRFFATDNSTSPQGMYFWPPANGAYVILVPYYKAHTDIASPESSTTAPWFPQSTYLYTRLAAEMMKISDDTRVESYTRECESMLTKYLKMQGDPDGYSKQVTMDNQYFRTFANLPNTKISGW